MSSLPLPKLLVPSLLALLVALIATGCAELLESIERVEVARDPSSPVRPPARRLAQGFTPCGTFMAPPDGSITCHPGTYCADAIFSECNMGCTSQFNCTEEEICQKLPGQHVGTCTYTGRHS